MKSLARNFKVESLGPGKGSILTSIKDVARLADVSVSTVSRVLRGSERVDEDTRARIEKAIEAINYRPNLLAQGLRSKSGFAIGLVLPDHPHETFASFVLHTEHTCAELGYNLIVGNTNGQPEAEATFVDNLIRRNVDGIIFSRVSDRSHVLSVLKRWKTPAVTIDRALGQEEIPTVVLDNYRAGQIAANHLVALGHKRLGVITGPQNVAISRERLKGFASVIEQNGLTLLTRDVFEGDFSYESGFDGGETFLGKDITAVWCQNDLMAVGAMNAFRKNGIEVPTDVSVMGMDNADISRMTLPTLTTLSQPFEEMCRVAVKLLVAMKTGDTIDERRVVLQPELVVRDSTAKLKENKGVPKPRRARTAALK